MPGSSTHMYGWMRVSMWRITNEWLIYHVLIATQLTRPLCDALPSFHVLTGCGNILPRSCEWPNGSHLRSWGPQQWAILESAKLQIAMWQRQWWSTCVCVLYVVNNITNLDQGRLHLFRKLYASKEKTDSLRKIKRCWPLLLTTTQTGTWAKAEENQLCGICLARKANPVEFDLDGHRWEISPDKLTIVWYISHFFISRTLRLMRKWEISWEWIFYSATGWNLGLGGSCDIYMLYRWPFRVQDNLGGHSVSKWDLTQNWIP